MFAQAIRKPVVPPGTDAAREKRGKPFVGGEHLVIL